MGCSPFKKNCAVYETIIVEKEVFAPNPNPAVFEILYVEQVGKHVVANIQYPDCTNYEGKKVCVFLHTTEKEWRKQKRLDPHFSKTGFSPFARFKPTDNGFDAAILLCKKIKSGNIKYRLSTICRYYQPNPLLGASPGMIINDYKIIERVENTKNRNSRWLCECVLCGERKEMLLIDVKIKREYVRGRNCCKKNGIVPYTTPKKKRRS